MALRMKRNSRQIVLLFEFPTLNGGERSMLQCIDRIERDEFQLFAVAPTGRLSEALQKRDVPVLPVSWRADERRCLQPEGLLALLRHFPEADLFHANSLSLGRSLGRIRARLSVPTTAHLRDIMRLRRAEIGNLNQHERLFAVSQATRDYHVGQGLSAARTFTVYNGVDCERFRPLEHRTFRLHDELQIPRDAFISLTIGQIGLRKGHDLLAAAAPLIVQHVPQVRFVVVGERNSNKQESWEFEENFRTAFARAGLSRHLHLLGYRDDVELLLPAADLLVHPAKQEPLGRVLLESAASGTAIVATSVGGTPEILVDGHSARLVTVDPSNLADGVIEMATDERLRRAYARAARDRILAVFTAEQAAERLCQQWRELLGG